MATETLKPKKKITVSDVARRAGVSPGTVSVVLNGIPSTVRFSDETRLRVQKTASEMGYQPNLVARNLARQRTDTIGLMISHLDNPFFVEVLHKAESLIFEAGYQVLLDANSHEYGEYQPVHKIAGWLVDGVLMWTRPQRSLTDYLGQQGSRIPAVYLGHVRTDATDYCAFDLYGAGRQLGEYLISRGHKRLCYLTPYRPSDVLESNHQMTGLLDVCREAGLEMESVFVEYYEKMIGSAFTATQAIAARPRGERPDVVICFNDHMALSAYHGLLSAGLRVPEDIALAGFDGTEQVRYLPPGPLTTVRNPVDVLCRTAVEILRARIAGDTETPLRQVLIPTELITGATA